MRNLIIAVLCFVSAASWAQEVTSKVTFTKRVAFNDSILIPASAGIGKVLTSNSHGYATWQTNPGLTAWSLTGNAGTNPATDFIGTTDGAGLYFKTFGILSGFLEDNNNICFGLGSSPNLHILDGGSNTVYGSFSAQRLSEGNSNLIIGSNSGNYIQNSANNTIILS